MGRMLRVHMLHGINSGRAGFSTVREFKERLWVVLSQSMSVLHRGMQRSRGNHRQPAPVGLSFVNVPLNKVTILFRKHGRETAPVFHGCPCGRVHELVPGVTFVGARVLHAQGSKPPLVYGVRSGQIG